MNREDICLNFAQSYFAVPLSSIIQSLDKEIVQKIDTQDLHRPMIPCTSPAIRDGKLTVILTYKVRSGAYEQTRFVFPTPWKDDMDEDKSLFFMNHPEIGMTGQGDSIAFLRRSAYRQRNRGFCPRYTSAAYACMEHPGIVPVHGHQVVWNVYNPVYMSFSETLDALDSGEKAGLPLSLYLGVFLEPRRKYPRLFYRTEVVGFVQNEEPYVYEDINEAIKDYIQKITGRICKVK